MEIATLAASTRLDPQTDRVQWQARFVPVPHTVLTHPKFQRLTGGSTKLLLAIAAAYVGNNNGHLVATLSRMRNFGFNSKESIARGLDQLLSSGYLVRTRRQFLRLPSLYAVTWLPINRPPSGQRYDPGISHGVASLDLWRVDANTTVEAA